MICPGTFLIVFVIVISLVLVVINPMTVMLREEFGRISLRDTVRVRVLFMPIAHVCFDVFNWPILAALVATLPLYWCCVNPCASRTVIPTVLVNVN